MDLSVKSGENVAFMLEQMQKQMQVVNSGVMKPEDYDIEQYDDLKDLHAYVMKKNHFSVRETEGIIQELSDLRKK
ncbi:DUF1128 domain-containing protein [Alkalihalobacillus sp. AL-G]|uniref:DUF1128 domain-containing protein n=1 Tax=Alkalihalobacillus sp. AL-G TaxID=2926399 RepID=UPI002729ACA0|nr:DUF1128 domain-containing protein [Alkalihalobacillus sp. AL-G]WLD95122.1 DUF1128 domain-containing protein [Alkalihalobacillus sp. AL-G]